MKISRNWLNNYIISDKTDSELVDAFTQLGLECTSEIINSLDSKIVIGRITSCKKHPNADRLKICDVDIKDELLTIVCGAPNVKENILVPIAKLGSCLDNFKIKKTKIRGIVSHGMICSEKELGLSEEHEGIMILDDSLKIGQELKNALSIKENTVFDFDMTPNRGDCFSHLGIARELSLIENSKIKKQTIEFKKYDFKTSDLIDVKVIDDNLCSRYSCKVIKDIKVTDSPEWLKNELKIIGQKSINNVVDLANYIMFDLGQPLHTFDYDKINGKKIDVRLAQKNEKILCLNNELKKLSDDDIVIADSSGPIAIAGVIGGFNSQVDSKTTNLLIESAVFNEINIRKTSKKYEYDKEASKRFERGIDYDNVLYAMDKFIKLLIDISGGKASIDFIDIKKEDRCVKKIKFNSNNCNDFLGIKLEINDYENIFSKLSIDTKNKGNEFLCNIPSYRNDLEREVDLFEEVARVYGYDRIPSELNFKFSSSSLIKDDNIIEDKIRNILSNNGFNEHYSNSLYNKMETSFSTSSIPVRIINPLSKDMEFVRNSLIPGMLKALSYNEKRECDFLKLYEIGSINIFNDEKYNLAIENRKLCLGYLGDKIISWNSKRKFDIYDVKGDISMMMHNLGINNVSYKVEHSNDDLNVLILIDNNEVGNIVILNDKQRKKYDILNSVIMVNIDLDELNKIYNQLEIMYNKIISYPSINRDIAILVNTSISHENIINTIFEVSSKLLVDINLFDIYQDESLDNNTKSMAYSLKFQSKDRTLTIKEVDKEMILIIRNLETKLEAKQR